MSDGSRTAQKWQRMSECTGSPTAPFIFQRWRADEETNQMKGFISALLRTNMAQSWARKAVLQSQVRIALNIYLKEFWRFQSRWLSCFRGQNDERESIGVLMKEKRRSGAVQDPSSPTQRTDDPYSQNGAFHVTALGSLEELFFWNALSLGPISQKRSGEAVGRVGLLGPHISIYAPGRVSGCSAFTLLTFLFILKHSYQFYSIEMWNFQHFMAYSEAPSLN